MRMPEMSGAELLAQVRVRWNAHPDGHQAHRYRDGMTSIV